MYFFLGSCVGVLLLFGLLHMMGVHGWVTCLFDPDRSLHLSLAAHKPDVDVAGGCGRGCSWLFLFQAECEHTV